MTLLSKRCRGWALVAVLAWAVPASVAQDAQTRGAALMQQVYEQGRQHPNQEASVFMRITDAKGRRKKRNFRSKYKILADRSKALIRFYRPSSIKGTGLLTETLDSEVEDDTKQWIYLPAFQTVRSLNTEEKHQSFMGSDLTNADVAGRKPSHDRHRLASEDDTYAQVVSLPRDETDLYSRLETKIHLETMVPYEIKFYDRDERLLKTLVNEKLGVEADMYYPLLTRVTNHQTGGTTVLVRESFEVDTKIGVNEVGLRGLRGK